MRRKPVGNVVLHKNGISRFSPALKPVHNHLKLTDKPQFRDSYRTTQRKSYLMPAGLLLPIGLLNPGTLVGMILKLFR
jgi:hypothetical protein